MGSFVIRGMRLTFALLEEDRWISPKRSGTGSPGWCRNPVVAPIAVTVASANPGKISLVADTLKQRFLPQLPTRIIGDRGYDSDALDAQLVKRGIEFIAPHRSTRRNKTQDGRQLRRYCRRWKIERLFAWLQNFRRLVTRYERHVENFLAFVHLACIVILSRRFVA